MKIISLRVPGLSQAQPSAGTRSEGWRLPGVCSCQEGSTFPCVIGCLGDVSPQAGISRDSPQHAAA